jgi:hypothetical protein
VARHLGQRLLYERLGAGALRKRDRVRAIEQEHGCDCADRLNQLRAG